MQSVEIHRVIKEFISPNVRQTVFAANRLPLYVSLPSYIICNLDPDHLPGSHWIAIYISESGYGEYFDSFGRRPTGSHLKFLKRNNKQFTFNNLRIQNDFTSVCGKYCIVYLYFKYRKCSTNYYLSMFDCNRTFSMIL